MRLLFQGRDKATWFSKLFFSYVKPLMDSAKAQPLRFEQYGQLPDRLKIQHEAKLIQAEIEHFIAKNPNDRYAFLKGVLSANRLFFLFFGMLRLILGIEAFCRPLLIYNFIEWLQDKESGAAATQVVLLAMLIPLSQGVKITIWE